MKNEDDLKRSVVEFLSQDKEFLGALEHSGLIGKKRLLDICIHKRNILQRLIKNKIKILII